jgi:hypothetical protein
MAILKVGDYVLVGVDGCEGVGRINALDFYGVSATRFVGADADAKRVSPEACLVQLLDGSMPMAVLRTIDLLKPIDPAFHKLLTDVYKERGDD